MSGPNRRRAIQLIAQQLPSVEHRLAGQVLHLTLKGPVMFSGEMGEGIHQIAVEACLDRHPTVATIDIALNSNGGSVSAAKGIYSALRRHAAYKIVNARNQCASAALTILLAGDFRTAELGTKFLAHETEADPVQKRARWTASQHRAMASVLERSNKELVALYAERTRRDPKEFSTEISRDRPMTLNRARDLGFIHCLAGQERWINGRPHYTGDEPLIQAMKSRCDRLFADFPIFVAEGSPLIISHAAFRKKAFSR